MLIVSEKKTALDVIFHRLGKIANFVLYIDDPNNKEAFYERMNSLLEFDDAGTYDTKLIHEKAVSINYELGKLHELEVVLDTKTSLDASLRALYHNSQPIDVKDPAMAKLFKAIQQKKKPYTLSQLITYQKVFSNEEFVSQLLQYKTFLPYEKVYQLLKEDIKDTDLQVPERSMGV